MTLIETEEKLNTIGRRNFDGDLRRHFVVTVRGSADAMVPVRSYTFVLNANALEYRRRPEVRTPIFVLDDAQLDDAQLIVNMIHPETELETHSHIVRGGRPVLTDGRKFSFDVNEFGVANSRPGPYEKGGLAVAFAISSVSASPQASLPLAGSASATSSNA
jgi:hypothetical protein